MPFRSSWILNREQAKREKKTKQNKDYVSQRTVSVLRTSNFNSSGLSSIVPETVRIRRNNKLGFYKKIQ